jgi:2-dehydro-3-deoxyphosphogluconate aldolase / (4S)-4-hydroxy-2-oxoglutarate aldolase
VEPFQDLARIRIIPVIVIDDPGAAPDLAAALDAGGIGCAEVTLRTAAGITAISAIAAEHPRFVVGAGTVLTIHDVDRIADAGASFAVSPGLDEAVVERAHGRGLAALPGIATATELQRAVGAGLERVKFFPAGSLGGIDAIDALSGPFPGVKFLPSGGVSASNARAYLDSPAVFAVSGSWMAPRELIAARDWDEITRRSAAAVELLTPGTDT